MEVHLVRGFNHPSLRTLFIRGELLKASPVTQISKNLPAMQETQVQTLGWEDSLEKGMTTHSRFLAWRIHGQRTVAGYSPWGHKEVDMTEQLTQYTIKSIFH